MDLRNEHCPFNVKNLFDTHCHLYMEPLSRDTGAVLERAYASGIERLLIPAVSEDNWDACIALSVFPGINCALGIHPWWADDDVDIKFLQEKLEESGAVAIGEIGLDWKTEVPRQKQFVLFEKQLQLAQKMDLPVIIHCRNAFEEMLEVLEKIPVRGVIHAWSRGPQLMNRFLDAGLYISFGGAITRSDAKKAHRSAKLVPSDRFVLETDSPSIGLADVAAGKTEPRHLAQIAQVMSVIRGESLEEIKEAAWVNSLALFGNIDESKI